MFAWILDFLRASKVQVFTPLPSIRRLGTNDVKLVCSPRCPLVRSWSVSFFWWNLLNYTFIAKNGFYCAILSSKLPWIKVWPLVMLFRTAGRNRKSQRLVSLSITSWSSRVPVAFKIEPIYRLRSVKLKRTNLWSTQNGLLLTKMKERRRTRKN